MPQTGIPKYCHAQFWNAIRDTSQSRPTLPSLRLLHWWYRMIWYRSSLVRQSYHFATDFDHKLLLVDILNTLFKHWVVSWNLSLKSMSELLTIICFVICEWVNVSSGTGSPGLSRTKSKEPKAVVSVCCKNIQCTPAWLLEKVVFKL